MNLRESSKQAILASLQVVTLFKNFTLVSSHSMLGLVAGDAVETNVLAYHATIARPSSADHYATYISSNIECMSICNNDKDFVEDKQNCALDISATASPLLTGGNR